MILLPVFELIEKYLNMLKKQKSYSANTIRAYRNDLDCFEKWLVSQDISRVDQLATVNVRFLRQFWAMRRTEKLSTQSMRRGVSAMRGLFKYALKNNYISKNPATLLETPKSSRPLPKTPGKLEIDILTNSTKNSDSLLEIRDNAIIELIYGSGLRVSEATSLCPDDIDLQNEKALIEGKGNKQRIVPLTPSACKAIQLYLSERNTAYKQLSNSSPVFLNKNGTPISARSIARMLEKHIKKQALIKKISPHQLRHAFATDMLNNGADIRAVQEILGHENLSTTQIYTRLTKDKLMQTYKSSHPRSGENNK